MSTPADFSDGMRLLSTIGSYWNSLFAERELLRAHADDVAAAYRQAFQNFMESLRALSRFDIDVYHIEHWYPLRVTRSQLLDLDSYFVQYDEQTTEVYGTSGLTYGQIAQTGRYAIPKPDTLAGTAFIHNRIFNPTLTLVENTDYVVLPDAIVFFNVNPFDSPLVSRRDVVDAAGNLLDIEITLWLQNSSFDWQYLWKHVGYVLDVEGESSQAYKDVLNAIWDSRLLGFSVKGWRTLLSAITGIPIVLEPTEIVRQIVDQTVITDLHTYVFHADDSITVVAGQILHAGDTMSDGLRFFEPSGSTRVVPDWLRSVPLSGGFIRRISNDLSFPNEDVALDNLGPDDEGHIRVRFQIYGHAADVEAFWASVHAYGSESGTTLAHLLDMRESPVGEPPTGSLPATVNPAQLVIHDWMGGHLVFARVRRNAVRTGLQALRYMPQVRAMSHPQAACVIILEDGPYAEEFDTSTAADEPTLAAAIADSENYDLSVASDVVNIWAVDMN